MIKVVTVTGYKPHELGIMKSDHPGIEYIRKAIKRRLISLCEQGLEWVTISGQLGVELWVAEVVFELRETYGLKLAVLTPFLEQEAKWNESNQEMYQFVMSSADYVKSITNRKYENPGQFKAKTQFLINNSDALLLLYDDEKEGSPVYMLREAEKRSKQESYEVYRITPFDVQLIVEEEQQADPSYWSQ